MPRFVSGESRENERRRAWRHACRCPAVGRPTWYVTRVANKCSRDLRGYRSSSQISPGSWSPRGVCLFVQLDLTPPPRASLVFSCASGRGETGFFSVPLSNDDRFIFNIFPFPAPLSVGSSCACQAHAPYRCSRVAAAKSFLAVFRQSRRPDSLAKLRCRSVRRVACDQWRHADVTSGGSASLAKRDQLAAYALTPVFRIGWADVWRLASQSRGLISTACVSLIFHIDGMTATALRFLLNATAAVCGLFGAVSFRAAFENRC